MLKHISRICTLLLLVCVVAGCGGEKATARAKVYKVTGKVTYLNAPLIGAAVSFAPKEGQPTAVGRTNDLGEFELTTYGGGDGAAAGDYAVLIVLMDSGSSAAAPKEAHGTDAGVDYSSAYAHGSKSGKASGGSLLPPKYGKMDETPLSAKVDPNGENKFTFEIK